MSLLDVVLRMIGHPVPKPAAIERADRVLDAVDTVRVTIVPKSDADLRASFRRANHRIAGR